MEAKFILTCDVWVVVLGNIRSFHKTERSAQEAKERLIREEYSKDKASEVEEYIYIQLFEPGTIAYSELTTCGEFKTLGGFSKSYHDLPDWVTTGPLPDEED